MHYDDGDKVPPNAIPAGASAGRIVLRVLDGFALQSADGHPLHVPSQKAAGILAYLALGQSPTRQREHLAGLCWSESSEERARNSLRQCLRRLLKVLASAGFHGLISDRNDVTLSSDGLSVDLLTIAERLDSGRVDRRLAAGEVQPDRILYGFEGLDPSFSAWLSVIRESWRSRIVDQLVRMLGRSYAPERRLDIAKATVAIDATHEEAHRCLIRGFADTGNIGSALQQYKMLWDLLLEEYDTEPAEETQSLIVAIKSGSYRPVGGPRSPTIAEPVPSTDAQSHLPTIGVPNFIQAGPWSLEDYWMEGFRREIIASLARFREWVVVDDTTQLDGPRQPPTASVNYRIEGSYYEDSGAVRLIVTLKEVPARRYVWSESFLVSREKWFVTQQEIIRKIGVALNVYLSAHHLSQLVTGKGSLSSAHIDWLKGQEHSLQWNPANARDAEDIYLRIIESTPDFAPAYSSLAGILNSKHFKYPGMRRDPGTAERGLKLAFRGVELDPLDTRAQLALGFANAMNGRFEQAELHFGLAYDLNPNSPRTLVPCAHGLSYCGDHVRAGEMIDTAVRMNPSMPEVHWGYALCVRYFLKDFEGAIKAADIAQDAIVDLAGWKAAALARAGRIEDAKEAGEHLVMLSRERWAGEMEPTREAIASWFMHCFPIRYQQDYDFLKGGLKLSGLPVGNVSR